MAALVLLVAPALIWLASRTGGYKRRPDGRPAGPSWERTGERFIDPTSDEMLEVWYRPQTGERAYVRG